jgi:hypothetical protein
MNQTKKNDKGDYVLGLTVSPHRFYHRGVRLSRLAAIKGFLMMGQRYILKCIETGAFGQKNSMRSPI